jgi:hypothetical protein
MHLKAMSQTLLFAVHYRSAMYRYRTYGKLINRDCPLLGPIRGPMPDYFSHGPANGALRIGSCNALRPKQLAELTVG